MSRPITARQLLVLKFVASFTTEHGYPPTLREIGDAIGASSTFAAADHLGYLERKGFLFRAEWGKSRTLVLTRSGSLLASGSIRSSWPSEIVTRDGARLQRVWGEESVFG